MPTDLTPQEILASLVAIPTVSRDSNIPIIDRIEAYLAAYGVESWRVPSDDGCKASLYAVIGPRVAGGVVLSGHTDVVPVEGQDWATDPFILTERAGRLYGRGAVDMKGFLALMLAVVPHALRAGLRRPLILAFSYDEEIGCEGCLGMIEAMARTLPPPAAVIVGEPTGLAVANGHKGSIAFNIRVKGHSVHSSMLHTGVSAVMEAARLVDWANRHNEAAATGVPDARDAAFEPPWTTAHVGVIAGGTANNITAAECTLTLDFRVVPRESLSLWHDRVLTEVARIRAGMQAIIAETDITVTPMFRVPPLAPEVDGAAEALAKRLARQNGTRVISFGTEAGQFQKIGWSTVVCGPGDISRAHKADEYIEIAELAAGMAFVERLADDLCG
ncbi:MAG TPA: acetylornithine deacetylase [Paenirhodobacter sp.]